MDYSDGYQDLRDARVALRSQYSFGDAEGLAQLENLLAGTDTLKVGYGEGEEALTQAAGNGGRTVSLASLGRSGDLYSRLKAGTVLQHEAHRDGRLGPDNNQETLGAVKAHTLMALDMARDYGSGLITSDANLMNDVGNYMTALQGGDMGAFEDYVNGAYDSSADYWKLSLLRNEKGEIVGKELLWDNELDFKIENADGTITTLTPDQMNLPEGLELIQQSYVQNGIGGQWSDDIAGAFGAVGEVSVNTLALSNMIQNNDAANSKRKIRNFKGSINRLLAFNLSVNGLPSLPDQDAKYSMMPGDLRRTTLFGNRLVTPELFEAGVTGEEYKWGFFNHLAEDFAGGTRELKTPQPAGIHIGYSQTFGLQLKLDLGNNYSLQSNHASASSSMNLLKAMLMSDSTSNLAAGIQFGTMGNTGVGTGIHNHLVGKIGNSYAAPSNIFNELNIPQAFTDSGVLLTGFPSDTPYNSPVLLEQILQYSATHPEFDKREYVSTHSSLFQPVWENEILKEFDPCAMTYEPVSSQWSFYVPYK